MCLENSENFDLEKEPKSASEAQKYKCMYGKAYKRHLFFLFRNLFHPNQTFLCSQFS